MFSALNVSSGKLVHRSTSELDLHHYHDTHTPRRQEKTEDKKKRGRSPFR